jgi:hypothetical protein
MPSWVSARDAAERSRQAAADLAGTEGAEAERAWQLERLAQHLGVE